MPNMNVKEPGFKKKVAVKKLPPVKMKKYNVSNNPFSLPDLEGVFPGGLSLPSFVVPTQGYQSTHTALDLAGPAGTPIYAPKALTIREAKFGTWGNDVIGTDLQGNKYIFGHFQSVAANLRPGMTVQPGTLLGLEGTTFNAAAGGYSTGPHLHLEERSKGGNPLLPSAADILAIFTGGGSRGPLRDYSPLAVAPAPSPNLKTAPAPLPASSISAPASTTTPNVGTPTIPPSTPASIISGLSNSLNTVATLTTPASKTAAGGMVGRALGIEMSKNDLWAVALGVIVILFGLALFLIYFRGEWANATRKEFDYALDAAEKLPMGIKAKAGLIAKEA